MSAPATTAAEAEARDARDRDRIRADIDTMLQDPGIAPDEARIYRLMREMIEPVVGRFDAEVRARGVEDQRTGDEFAAALIGAFLYAVTPYVADGCEDAFARKISKIFAQAFASYVAESAPNVAAGERRPH